MKNFILPLFSCEVDDAARSDEGREEVEEAVGNDEFGRGESENGIAVVTASLKSVTLSLPLENAEVPPFETETEFTIPPKLEVDIEVGMAGMEWEISIGVEVEIEVV